MIGYDDPVDPGFMPAVGIHEMRRALQECGGVFRDVDETVTELCAKTLTCNYRDCHGMREVMLQVVG